MKIFLTILVGVALSAEASSQAKLRWHERGWYTGASLGVATFDAEGGDIDADLANLGYTSTTSLDDNDLGWRFFGGYRFDAPFSVELAWADLGVIDSEIDATFSDVDQFIADVADIHPFSGEGVSLTGIWWPLDLGRFDVGLEAGLWWWQADVDVDAATGESVDIDEDGVDFTFGLSALFELGDCWLLRADADRYRLDDNDVNSFSLGLQYCWRDSTAPRATRNPAATW
jgi:hypothetical protein